ncbi:thiol reductant ABC exporter subunit CydD [Flavisphingomonas formosensis]|uniref:thiol reductant ABC exporter subunit CydD n=1 Tax=Flavisphingomonas formosensis TaxID=861534 RepID=UPI0012FC727F|nr:thiol reductant ABC exporter subunit CydD [Sphingomonas formosensis]
MSGTRASLLWVADGAGAIGIALALALAVSDPAANRGFYVSALILLVASGALRAWVQTAAATTGSRSAAAAKAARRPIVLAALLGVAPGSRRLLGEQVADATDRLEDMDGYHARFRPLRTAAVATPLLVAAAAAFASPIGAGILLATLLPFAIGMALAGSTAGRAAAAQLEVLSRLSGLFIDRVRALPVIVGFGAEDRITRQLAETTREVALRTIAVLRVAFLSGAILEFFAALSVALVAVYCGFNLLGLLPFPVPERLDLARALFVLVLAPEFYLPMRRLAAAYHDKQVGEAAIERLDALAATAEPERAADAVMLARPPAIRFEAVVIDYGERRIGPFTLDIAAGRATALSGATGTGKSSLLHALLGLAPVAEGRIWIDGQPLAAGGLGGAVSWAGQAIALVPGTLAGNIGIARPDADRAAIAEAAERAGLGPLIAARDGGLDLPIDATGSGLSGGERRRIGIARALLRDAPLWLLDEPTADLDEASAATLTEAVLQAGRGRTLLFVTHSAAAAARADAREVLA